MIVVTKPSDILYTLYNRLVRTHFYYYLLTWRVKNIHLEVDKLRNTLILFVLHIMF